MSWTKECLLAALALASCVADARSVKQRTNATDLEFTAVAPLEKRAAQATWTSLGCYSDSSARTLTSASASSNSVTVEWCQAQCASAGYQYAGLEYATQCYCGNSISNGGKSISSSNCNMACVANSGETCGGTWALSMYQATYSSTLTTSSGKFTYVYQGCLADSSTRVLASASTSGSQMTDDWCANYCGTAGYAYAGTEYFDECYCGNTLTSSTASTGCTAACKGDSSQICGGTWALSVYAVTSVSGSGSSGGQTGTYNGGTFSGGACMADSQSRILTGAAYNSGTYTYASPSLCAGWCANQGFSMFGLEYGNQCYCGNSIPANTPTSSNCNMACNADSSQICGGTWAINVYTIQPGSTSATTAPTTATATPTKTSTTTATPAPATTTPPANNGQGIVTSNAAAALQTGTTAPASAPVRPLYAHYIVGNTLGYTQAMWAADVAQAQSAGFDAFALNLGSPSWELPQITNAFQAAAAANWKAFLSLDVTSLSCQSTSDAQNLANLIVNTYKAFPATSVTYTNSAGVYTILTSVFGGNYCSLNGGTPLQFWNQVRAFVQAGGCYVTFAPSMFTDPTQFAAGGVEEWADVPFNWNSGWPMGAANLDSSSDLQWISGSGNKPYMAAISPCFFTYYGPNSWNKDWIYRSDDWLLATRFEMLIGMRDQVQFAELVSWNDYGESHYIGTIGPNQPNSQGWTNGMPHTAWLSLINWYSTAWKTGSYPAPFDGLWLWSRPHPKAAIASAPTNPKPSNWQYTDDNLYVIAMLASPAQVKIVSGSNYAVANLQAGMNKLSLASAAGPVGMSISRDGAVVKYYDSTNIFTYILNPVDYNFNYFVASV